MDDLRDDDQLEAALRDALDQDLAPIPPDLERFAREAMRWMDIDGELARLTSDSAMAGDRGVRGPDDQRLLTFDSPTGTVTLQVGRGEVVGSIRPAGEYEVDAAGPEGGHATTATDSLGRFRLRVVTPFRISISGEHGTFTTEWITA